jgi:hypothetical protein
MFTCIYLFSRDQLLTYSILVQYPTKMVNYDYPYALTYLIATKCLTYFQIYILYLQLMFGKSCRIN